MLLMRRRCVQRHQHANGDVQRHRKTKHLRSQLDNCCSQASPEEKLIRQFKEAAERVKKQQQLETLSTEQRIVAQLKAYMEEWKGDLDARPPEAVNTTIGLQVCTWHPCVCVLPYTKTPSIALLDHARCKIYRTTSTSDGAGFSCLEVSHLQRFTCAEAHVSLCTATVLLWFDRSLSLLSTVDTCNMVR